MGSYDKCSFPVIERHLLRDDWPQGTPEEIVLFLSGLVEGYGNGVIDWDPPDMHDDYGGQEWWWVVTRPPTTEEIEERISLANANSFKKSNARKERRAWELKELVRLEKKYRKTNKG